MSTNNSSSVIVDGGPGIVYVEQGPQLLASFLYAPPDWARDAISVVTLVLFIGMAIGYRRHGLDREVAREMAFNVLVVGGVLVVTSQLVQHMDWPYLADVGFGTVGGFLLAKAGFRLGEWLLAEHREHTAE